MDEGGFNSFPLGFVLGFFAGCVGLLIALVAGGPKSKSGAILGFMTALTLGGCVGGLAAVLQIALMNM